MTTPVSRRLAFAALIACVCLAMTACSPLIYGEEPYSGMELSSDDLESIYHELSTDGSSERQTAQPPTYPDSLDVNTTVYWTEGGSVYHTDQDCPHYKNSTDKISGTLDLAMRSGKKRLCSACESREDDAQPQNTSEGESIYDIS